MVYQTTGTRGATAKIARRAVDLGSAYARRGRFDDAAAHYRRALALDPLFADAHNNLGNIRMAQGDLAAAVACYERCLAIDPNTVLAHDNLGLALLRQGKLDEAAASHRRALALDPRGAVSHYNLGNVLLGQKEIEAALLCYQNAVALRPDYAAAHLNLGNALRLTGDLAAASASYRRAATIQPNFALAHHNLGNTYLEQDRLEEAVACLCRALALRPDYAEAHISLGNALHGQGRFSDALACFRRACSIQPNDASAHVNAACMLLLAGEFSAGWAEYEWRRQGEVVALRGQAIPAWRGQRLRGETILLHCEQGLGDSIQFIRYARAVKDQGAQVVLYCPPALERLFEGVAGIDHICPHGRDLPACDYHVPLLSLPFLFDTLLETIPCDIPYIEARADSSARWAERLRLCRGLKVGLVWAGNPRIDQPNAHQIDRRRSMRLRDFAPLADLPDIQFVSLQKGVSADQATQPPPGLALTDFMSEVTDFADTAGLVANLDLVIGVDTSIIHLAGAMGKPVWMLSRFDGCWRWLLERQDSPWYQTLRLFRQPAIGDWQSVVANVTGALRQRLGARSMQDPGSDQDQAGRKNCSEL
jgi:tetratricopeptide (TPR) repeat protein